MSKKSVRIVEVGLRDGLQNESLTLSFQDRIKVGEKLLASGVKFLEVGAFVRSDRIPQMIDSDKVVSHFVTKYPKFSFPVLVPNLKGYEQAIDAGTKEIAVFTAASESFCQKNINCSIAESFERFAPVIELAKKNKVKVRGYLSTAFGCPFEGKVSEKKVIELVVKLLKMGCYEVSIGDTIGVANPKQVQDLLKKLKTKVPLKKVAGHFHDTRGTALANILASYQMGVTVFDSSIGGLGGCPYAPGASGNVSTEDVVYMFDGMGVSTGLKLDLLLVANHTLASVMKKDLPSKVGRAGLPKNR